MHEEPAGTLYGVTVGEDANANYLLEVLKLTRLNIGRCRDTYLDVDGKFIHVLTRNTHLSQHDFKCIHSSWDGHLIYNK